MASSSSTFSSSTFHDESAPSLLWIATKDFPKPNWTEVEPLLVKKGDRCKVIGTRSPAPGSPVIAFKLLRLSDKAEGYVTSPNYHGRLYPRPVGFPFRVVKDITYGIPGGCEANPEEWLDLKKGTVGLVHQLRKDAGQPDRIEVEAPPLETPGGKSKFWVKLQDVEIGPRLDGDRITYTGSTSTQQAPDETDTHSKLIWTRLDVPGKCAKFRRTAYDVLKDVDGKFVVLEILGRNSGTPFRLQLSKLECPGLEHGQALYPVVEINLDGTPHEVPYAHLPDVGPFADWHVANTLGIKIFYQDSSTRDWHESWIQSPSYLLFSSSETEFFLPYVNAMALRRYFLQQTRMELRTFEEKAEFSVRANIKRLNFDVFTQCASFPDLVPKPEDQQLPLPRTKDTDEIRQELLNLGVGRVGGQRAIDETTALTTQQNELQTRAFVRQVCDRCLMLQGRGLRSNCEALPSAENCKACAMMGSECTWTPMEQITERIIIGLVGLQIAQNAVADIGEADIEIPSI